MIKEIDYENEDKNINWGLILLFQSILVFILLFLGIGEMKLKGNHNFIWAVAFISGIMVYNLINISLCYWENKFNK